MSAAAAMVASIVISICIVLDDGGLSGQENVERSHRGGNPER